MSWRLITASEVLAKLVPYTDADRAQDAEWKRQDREKWTKQNARNRYDPIRDAAGEL